MTRGFDPAGPRPGPAQTERRSAQRLRQIKGAKIVWRDGHSSLDCEIQNLSETGARLRLANLAELPESFALHFQDGRKRPVEVVWRKGELLGVRFLGEHGDVPTAAAPSESGRTLLARIARIERELTALRNEVLIRFRD